MRELKPDKDLREVLTYIRIMGQGLEQHGENFVYYSKYCQSTFIESTYQLQKELDKQSSNTKDVNENNRYLLYMVLIAILSIISSILVAFTIIFNKKLRGHPNMLMAYMAIANIGSCYNTLIWASDTQDVVCYFGWADLLYQTINTVFPSYDFTLI